jgi:hypothetical protein
LDGFRQSSPGVHCTSPVTKFTIPTRSGQPTLEHNCIPSLNDASIHPPVLLVNRTSANFSQLGPVPFHPKTHNHHQPHPHHTSAPSTQGTFGIDIRDQTSKSPIPISPLRNILQSAHPLARILCPWLFCVGACENATFRTRVQNHLPVGRAKWPAM